MLQDATVSHMIHATGFFSNNYGFVMREIGTMPVHPAWRYQPPYLAHFITKMLEPAKHLFPDAYMRYQTYVDNTLVEWNSGQDDMLSIVQSLQSGMRPGQTIYCISPLLAGIFQIMFPRTHVFDIHDMGCEDLTQYPYRRWTCPFIKHRQPEPGVCVLPVISRMREWYYTELVTESESESESAESGIEA